jgi:hypothetical protein
MLVVMPSPKRRLLDLPRRRLVGPIGDDPDPDASERATGYILVSLTRLCDVLEKEVHECPVAPSSFRRRTIISWLSTLTTRLHETFEKGSPQRSFSRRRLED